LLAALRILTKDKVLVKNKMNSIFMPLLPRPAAKWPALVLLLFAAYFILGLVIHSDYGMSWDEPVSRTDGVVSLKYAVEKLAPSMITGDSAKNIPDLHSWPDKDYGVAFEMPVAALELLLHLKDSQDIYIFRHLATFLAAFLGAVAVYATARNLYKDYRFGLLAVLMLIFSPRMFAESFYNSKDIVFMASIAVAIYTMTVFLSRPRLPIAIIHGFCCAFAIDVRIMGVMMVLCTVGVLLIKVIKRETAIGNGFWSAAAYVGSCSAFVFLMFPFLWDDPAGNFLLAFSNMAKFRWAGAVLYMGEIHKATDLPWHYIPIWILITTPPLFLVLMGVGAFKTIRQLWFSKLRLWANEKEMFDLLMLALLIVPIAAVIVLSSVLYDGWRQMYFVYPALILIATKGAVTVFDAFRENRRIRTLLWGMLLLCCSYNGYWMWAAHPLQNVYFNFLVGNDWKSKFELDYWGLANREALQFILDNDNSPVITIRAESQTPLEHTLLILNRKDRDRIAILPVESTPLYLLTNYRQFKSRALPKPLDDHTLFYRKQVDGETILSVFRINDPQKAARVTKIDRAYSADEIRKLNYRFYGRSERDGKSIVALKINNNGLIPISALSGIGKPIHIAWRFLDASGKPASEWDRQKNLPADIPAKGELSVQIAINPKNEIKGGTLQISMEQESAFWAHDIGLQPLEIPWE